MISSSRSCLKCFANKMSGFSITKVCPVKRRCNLTCYHCTDNNVEIAKIKLVCASPKYCSNQKIFGIHSHYRRCHQMVGGIKETNLKIFLQRWRHPNLYLEIWAFVSGNSVNLVFSPLSGGFQVFGYIPRSVFMTFVDIKHTAAIVSTSPNLTDMMNCYA